MPDQSQSAKSTKLSHPKGRGYQCVHQINTNVPKYHTPAILLHWYFHSYRYCNTHLPRLFPSHTAAMSEPAPRWQSAEQRILFGFVFTLPLPPFLPLPPPVQLHTAVAAKSAARTCVLFWFCFWFLFFILFLFMVCVTIFFFVTDKQLLDCDALCSRTGTGTGTGTYSTGWVRVRAQLLRKQAHR